VADPSEAIRSDIIVGEIEKRFRVIARVDYGGTILNLLLEHIAHNFNREDENDVAILRLLAKAEDLLIRHEILPSDFTVMAMQKDRFPAAVARRVRSLAKSALHLSPAGGSRVTARRRLPASTDASRIDFRREAHSGEVVGGFYHWEGAFRWMGPRGELVLRMSSPRFTVLMQAPVSQLRQHHK